MCYIIGQVPLCLLYALTFFCIFRGPKHHGRQFGRPFSCSVCVLVSRLESFVQCYQCTLGQPNSSFSQQKLLWPGFSVSSPCFDSGQPCLKGRPPLQAREYTSSGSRPPARQKAGPIIQSTFGSSFSPRSTALKTTTDKSRHVPILAFSKSSNLIEVNFEVIQRFIKVAGKIVLIFKSKQCCQDVKNDYRNLLFVYIFWDVTRGRVTVEKYL